MTESADDPKHLDLGKFLDPKKVKYELKSPETPDEIRSRLKLAEVEAEHRLRTQEAEDAHKRQISLIVHLFVMAMVTVAFLASTYIAVNGDPKTGLPDKAMGIITAIVAGGVGYMTGKGTSTAPRPPAPRYWRMGYRGLARTPRRCPVAEGSRGDR